MDRQKRITPQAAITTTKVVQTTVITKQSHRVGLVFDDDGELISKVDAFRNFANSLNSQLSGNAAAVAAAASATTKATAAGASVQLGGGGVRGHRAGNNGVTTATTTALPAAAALVARGVGVGHHHYNNNNSDSDSCRSVSSLGGSSGQLNGGDGGDIEFIDSDRSPSTTSPASYIGVVKCEVGKVVKSRNARARIELKRITQF